MKKSYKVTPYAYAYAIGRIRVLETQLIREDIFKEMLMATETKEALGYWTRIKLYSTEPLNIKSPEDLEMVLEKEEEKLDYLIKSLIIDESLFIILKKSNESPEDAFRELTSWDNHFLKDYLRHKIDLINIKELFRLKKEKGFLDFGFLPKKKFLELLNKPQETIRAEFQNTVYYKIVNEGLDYFNREGTFIYLEKLCDDFLIDFIKAQKFISSGPGPLLAYYLAKLNEFKCLRLIFLGKLLGLEEKFIQPRINKTYV